MTMILDGKAVADATARQMKLDIEKNTAERAPKLVVFRDKGKRNPFVSGLVERAGEVGIDIDVLGISHIPMVNEQMVAMANRDDEVDGIIVADKCANAMWIRRKKDVDHHLEDSPYRPAVALAVTKLLDAHDYDVWGREAVVVGRSSRVGLPIALDLLSKGATVTVCHTATKDLGKVVKRADLVVSCAGDPNIIRPSFIKEGAWVIDVGGDVQWSDDTPAAAMTPRTGGIGPLTVVCALTNVVRAWSRKFWRWTND